MCSDTVSYNGKSSTDKHFKTASQDFLITYSFSVVINYTYTNLSLPSDASKISDMKICLDRIRYRVT